MGQNLVTKISHMMKKLNVFVKIRAFLTISAKKTPVHINTTIKGVL